MSTPVFIMLHPNAKNITGQTYGRLVARGPVGRTPAGYVLWLCRCTCGTMVKAQQGNLSSGHTKSCGCLKKDTAGAQRVTHGDSGSAEHDTWKGMHTRCYNPRTRSYPRYGGRGIRITARWKKYEAFLHDMGRKPTPKHSIERLDNDKNYGPTNCVWATQKIQSRNTSRTRAVTYRGRTLSVATWAEVTGIPYHTLYQRICKLGWRPEDALRK